MLPGLDHEIPVVVVSNITEAFFEFPNRADDQATRTRLIHHAQCQGERSLFWLGDSKLVFVSFLVPHADQLCRQLGYCQTYFAAPAKPSPSLSLDILREAPLIDRLLEQAGPGRTIQLIPYATTPQFLELAGRLRTDHGLKVLLPESPSPESFWLRDYVDTKVGFRALAPAWLSNSSCSLPSGMICRDLPQAASVAYWFSRRGQTCLVKADNGMGSLGHQVVEPGQASAAPEIRHRLEAVPYLQDDLIVVEEFIPSTRALSPSLELYVPPPAAGRPVITYLCNQLFAGFGNSFVLSREYEETPWYPALAESGRQIAVTLQELGYVGHFDIDTVIDDRDRVYLVEINARRTAGTHIHECARFLFGPDYLNEVVLAGYGAMPAGQVTEPDHLFELLDDLLYPIQQERRGIIITVTSSLPLGDFGCIIVADSSEEAAALQRELIERVDNANR
jgi:hypothetical protein